MITKVNNKKETEQNAVVFITYMMGASYFNLKAECSSAIMEKRLELYYRELPVKKQLQFESICDNYMKGLLKEIPSDMWDMRASVKVKIKEPEEENMSFEISFETWKYELSLLGVCNDKGRIEYSHTIHQYGV